MSDFLEKQTGEITKYDDKLVRQLVKKVLVYDEKWIVTFKSGLEVEIER